MVRRGEMTDQQWGHIQPLLPKREPGKAGRKRHDDRRIINGILWHLRTGAPWRDTPERYGNWHTVYSRWRRWCAQGVWQRLLDGLLAAAEAQGLIDWSAHHVDATIIRAHQHAAGAQKKTVGPRPWRLEEAKAASAPRFTFARTVRAVPSHSLSARGSVTRRSPSCP